MEIKREPVSDFRVNQLRARDMLRGDLEGVDLENYVAERVLTTTVEKAVGWAQGNSLYPLTFGLACCAIEMMAIVGSRMDVARFGFEAMRASPRQADLIILSGRVSIKMAPVIRRLWDQMLEPKWAISMGACCSSTGVFNNYALVPGGQVHADRRARPRLPAAARVAHARDPAPARQDPGPPVEGWRERYEATGTEEIVPYNPGDPNAANLFLPGDTAGA